MGFYGIGFVRPPATRLFALKPWLIGALPLPRFCGACEAASLRVSMTRMAKITPPKPPRPKSDRNDEAPIAALEFRFDCLRYGHWAPRAERARLAAYILWRVAGDRTGLLTALWHNARYSYGDAGIAMLDGFRRESAVAIELIIKAVIAEQLKLRRASERVPHTHNIQSCGRPLGFPNSTGGTNTYCFCSNPF
jgi:hypothetical protein